MEIFKKSKFQLGLVIFIGLGIFASVYLTQQIQILISKAADGLSWKDFVESFGAGSGDQNFNADFDINIDGRINIFDILIARKENKGAHESSGNAEASSSATSD
jgi:hypothetical protein